jgi:hypothetical protein
MQVPKIMCPPWSYYDKTLDACVPVSPDDFNKQPQKNMPPVNLPAKVSPNEAVLAEVAARTGI